MIFEKILNIVAKDQASPVLDKVKQSAKEVDNQVAISNTNMQNGFSLTTLKIAAVATSLFYIGKQAVDAFAESETASIKLRNALSNAGITSERTALQVEAFSKKIQQTTRFEDDAVTSLQALIISIGGLTGKNLEDVTMAALNMSLGLNISAESAAKLILKAEDGALSLKKFGIEAKGLPTILDAVNSKWGGLAIKDADSTVGAIERIKNAFGDMMENIGQQLSKPLIQISPVIIALISNLGKGVISFLIQLGYGYGILAVNTIDFVRLVLTAFDTMTFGLDSRTKIALEQLDILSSEYRSKVEGLKNDIEDIWKEDTTWINLEDPIKAHNTEIFKAKQIIIDNRTELEKNLKTEQEKLNSLRIGSAEYRVQELVVAGIQNRLKGLNDQLKDIQAGTSIFKGLEMKIPVEFLPKPTDEQFVGPKLSTKPIDIPIKPVISITEEVKSTVEKQLQDFADSLTAGDIFKLAIDEGAFQKVSDSISLIGNLTSQNHEQEAAALEREKNDKLSYYDAEIAAAGNNQTKKDALLKQRKAAEDEYNSKIKEEKKKAWQAEHDAQLSMAIINGAVAVTKTWAELGPLGWIGAALVSAQTALQIGLIASQKPPNFALGTSRFIVPSGYNNDNFPIMVSSGEKVQVTRPGSSDASSNSGHTTNYFTFGHGWDENSVMDAIKNVMRKQNQTNVTNVLTNNRNTIKVGYGY